MLCLHAMCVPIFLCLWQIFIWRMKNTGFSKNPRGFSRHCETGATPHPLEVNNKHSIWFPLTFFRKFLKRTASKITMPTSISLDLLSNKSNKKRKCFPPSYLLAEPRFSRPQRKVAAWTQRFHPGGGGGGCHIGPSPIINLNRYPNHDPIPTLNQSPNPGMSPFHSIPLL